MAITSASWDPAQYLRFARERLRPAIDLLGRVPLDQARRVVDLGCGTGNVTAILRQRFPDADVLGVDGSEDMLAKARAGVPDARFETADFATWTPATPPDLIYSNAALHWANGHEALFPRLVSLLAPGGVLAVQMPAMHNEPLRALQNTVSTTGPWAPLLADAGFARGIVTRRRVLRPDPPAGRRSGHVGSPSICMSSKGKTRRPNGPPDPACARFWTSCPRACASNTAPPIPRPCARITQDAPMARPCCRSAGCSSSHASPETRMAGSPWKPARRARLRTQLTVAPARRALIQAPCATGANRWRTNSGWMTGSGGSSNR